MARPATGRWRCRLMTKGPKDQRAKGCSQMIVISQDNLLEYLTDKYRWLEMGRSESRSQSPGRRHRSRSRRRRSRSRRRRSRSRRRRSRSPLPRHVSSLVSYRNVEGREEYLVEWENGQEQSWAASALHSDRSIVQCATLVLYLGICCTISNYI